MEDGAMIGAGTMIWAHVQVRSGAEIGRNCVFGHHAFVDVGVIVGNNVKVQNGASLHEGVVVEDGVFVGPHVVFTNDRVPRAINPDGTPKTAADWHLGSTLVHRGASIGAGAVVVTGVTIGSWAMVGAGAVVTRDVPDFALVLGSPARLAGYVSASGVKCATQQEARVLTRDENGTSNSSSGEDR
ncbi:MAG: acyltransferase [Ilumatobacteraceae bacterium]